MKLIKKILGSLLALTVIFSVSVYAENATQVDTNVSTQLVAAKSGILMEQSTGEVLYEFNPDEAEDINPEKDYEPGALWDKNLYKGKKRNEE